MMEANQEILVNQYLKCLVWEIQNSQAEAGDDPKLEQILNLALEILLEGDFQQRWEVAKILPKLGNKAIAPLLSILEDQEADLEIRWFVGRILGEFDHPEIILSLVKILQETNEEELSMMAAATLAKIGPSAIEALTTLLKNPSSRMLAVISLAQIRHSQTILPLLTVIDDTLPEIRATVIEALGSFHDEHLITFLLGALKDCSSIVRKEAVIAVGMQSQFQEKFDLVNQIKPLLYDPEREVCQQAIIALGRMEDNEAGKALFTLLKSPATPNMLKKEAIRALSWIETSQSLVYLQEGLRWGNLLVCQEIITALGRQERSELKEKSSQILIDFLDSNQEAPKEPQIRQSVAISLGELQDRASLDLLRSLAKDLDQGVRLHAIAALRKFS
ncbi:MAG TPA: PBS lyase [Cyanothece sp. UBA12306]|nr:PBS lyase [Cyanothece sp. UBA12306]